MYFINKLKTYLKDRKKCTILLLGETNVPRALIEDFT